MRTLPKAGAGAVLCSLAIVLGVLLLTGCGGSGSSSSGSNAGSSGTESAGADGNEYTIGFVQPGPDAPFWVETREGAEEAKLSEATVSYGSGTHSENVTEWIPVIENLITQEVDAMVVPGVEQIIPALKKVQAADIPIIFYADGIPGSDLATSTVNTDSVKSGELAGEYIKEQTNGGEGSLAIIRYPKGEYPLIDERVEGVENGLKGTKMASEIEYSDVGCEEAPAMHATQNILTKNPEISAIFGECGAPILGAQQAIKQANVPPGQIVTAAIDGSEPEIEAIIAGEQGATVAQYPHKMGRMAVETAEKVLKGESVPSFIPTGSLLITKENAKEALHEKR
ncbi:MAG: sugar ABC transporter substrate-binding protein [Actinobacteria bacterium]|nr:sugar ABC transporter substrate-binding protein [Actinomycetota bacterium]